jgi:hypothetical protein
MKYLPILAMIAASLAQAQNAPPVHTSLKVGDTAPDFTLPPGSMKIEGMTKLSDFRGKKNVILAFFPAAFTGG